MSVRRQIAVVRRYPDLSRLDGTRNKFDGADRIAPSLAEYTVPHVWTKRARIWAHVPAKLVFERSHAGFFSDLLRAEETSEDLLVGRGEQQYRVGFGSHAREVHAG